MLFGDFTGPQTMVLFVVGLLANYFIDLAYKRIDIPYCIVQLTGTSTSPAINKPIVQSPPEIVKEQQQKEQQKDCGTGKFSINVIV